MSGSFWAGAQSHISLEKAPSVLLIHGDKIRMGARKTTGGLTLSCGGCCVRGAGIFHKTSSVSSSVHLSQSQRRRKGQTGVGGRSWWGFEKVKECERGEVREEGRG